MARSRLKLLFWCERGGRRAVDLYASDESVLRAADVRGLRPRQRRRSASTSRAHAAAAVTIALPTGGDVRREHFVTEALQASRRQLQTDARYLGCP
jgi:hypothetical protein